MSTTLTKPFDVARLGPENNHELNNKFAPAVSNAQQTSGTNLAEKASSIEGVTPLNNLP